MFLRTDQFTSSKRIETLFDTCFTLSWPKIFFPFQCFLVFPGNLRWLTSSLRDVTGEALLRLAVLVSLLERPASGSSVSELVKSRLVLKALLFILSSTSLDKPTADVTIGLFL